MDLELAATRMAFAVRLGALLRDLPDEQQDREIRDLLSVFGRVVAPMLHSDDRIVLMLIARFAGRGNAGCLVLTETRAIRIPVKLGLFGGKTLPSDVFSFEELRAAGLQDTCTPEIHDRDVWMTLRTEGEAGWSATVLDSESLRVWRSAGQVILGLAKLTFSEDGCVCGLKVGE